VIPLQHTTAALAAAAATAAALATACLINFFIAWV